MPMKNITLVALFVVLAVDAGGFESKWMDD
jgi:hypothetical protein